jgi:hypothetical protein
MEIGKELKEYTVKPQVLPVPEPVRVVPQPEPVAVPRSPSPAPQPLVPA